QAQSPVGRRTRVLVWLPSIAELLTHHPNNLTQIIRWATSGSGQPIGIVEGAKNLSQDLAR
ncbi:MAG: hypothetical protein L0G89_09125, partial [Janibacter sp.]|nr:hypothetical protein [Janibacter sp.]